MTKVVNKHGLATVLGRAMMDPNFADALSQDPAAAASGMWVALSPDEVAAVKNLNTATLTSAAAAIRGNLGVHAIFDQQQQQARMD